MSTETPACINKKTGGVFVAVESVRNERTTQETQINTGADFNTAPELFPSTLSLSVHSCYTSSPRPRHDALQSAVSQLYK